MAKSHYHYTKQAREGKARIDLILEPELAERFKTLPGLEKLSHAERVERLCECWEAHGTRPPPGDETRPPDWLEQVKQIVSAELAPLAARVEQLERKPGTKPKKKKSPAPVKTDAAPKIGQWEMHKQGFALPERIKKELDNLARLEKRKKSEMVREAVQWAYDVGKDLEWTPPNEVRDKTMSYHLDDLQLAWLGELCAHWQCSRSDAALRAVMLRHDIHP